MQICGSRLTEGHHSESHFGGHRSCGQIPDRSMECDNQAEALARQMGGYQVVTGLDCGYRARGN
ncbi:hypothetical protein DPMN_122647 [Dreissena polymorpha]|uniref:Uncharacterized protein n=1 Tax=Dreissena polymorpha TaxID=45954 RepID=A0A9D4GQ26_DREPO|nr:hypothetical protein DPMN_122647 [Dreissena polymorpha]